MKATRLFFEWFLLLALAFAGAVYLQSSGLTYRLDNQLLDNVSAATKLPSSEQIHIVAIDDNSLAEVGGWPWPRSVHAELVEKLDAAGAKAIVLDVLFLEPSTPEEDASLAAAMRQSSKVLLPHTFIDRPNAEEEGRIDPYYPLAELLAAAAKTGHVAAQPDADGILRRFDLERSTDKGEFPHLAVSVLDQIGEEELARAYSDEVLISFEAEDTYPVSSASGVLSDAYSPQYYKDKIVLVGATAQGMGDRYSAPGQGVRTMTGVETQANLIDSLLTGAVITQVDATWQNTVACMALIILFIAFWFLSPRACLIITLGLIASLLTASLGLLTLRQMWLPVVPAIVIIVLAYPLWSWRRLTLVSRYLDREASRLMGPDAQFTQQRGMEYVAQKVSRVKGLIGGIEDSLSYLKQVIEAAPDAMLVLDADNRVQLANEKADELFPKWQEHDAPKLNEIFATSRATLISDGGEMISEDGRAFLVARAQLAKDETAQLTGEILAFREITALRRLDQERKQMLEFLSHDMRTPQVAIIGLTRTNGDAPSPEDTMTRIRKQANRTLKLADDFVQLARLESPELQLEDSDIGALIEEACDRAYVLAEAKHIEIKQDLPDEPCFGDVDASLIARLLDNLIGNAVKYSPENTAITVGLSCDGEKTHKIIVSDQGVGLPEARVRDPFARFGAHATHAGPSAGLGLALVKKVVDAHNGTIEVTSAQGKGTTFAITLPN